MSATDTETLKSSLAAEFQAVSLNLASKSLTSWGKWDRAKNFPVAGSWQDKLLFIDNTLKEALNPQQHRPNDRMFWRTRPDLNKYRGWLLHRVLHHEMLIQKGDKISPFILPEDLPKLVDDLYLFHKHKKTLGNKISKEAGTIQHYKTLDALHHAVEPYAPQYPFTAQEQQEAHKKYLAEYGGNGEARLIATLEDGTELIQVQSERASRAYGSPRWCTAYRDQATYFDDYSDNLLVAIDPNGQRWQFHFRASQFHNENDVPIKNISEFFAHRKDLTAVLIPFLDKACEYHKIRLNLGKSEENTAPAQNYIDFCATIKNVPVWAAHARKKGYFAYAITEGHLDRLFDNYESTAKKNGLFGFTSRDYIGTFWPNILSIPEWRAHALKEDRLGKILGILFSNTATTKGLGFRGHSDGNNAAKSFMFMMPLFHNQPGFRESMAPYVAEAHKKGIGQIADHKIKRSRRRRFLLVDNEILKYSGHCKEWRSQIPVQSIERSMKDGTGIHGVLELGKKWASFHWIRAVMASDAIANYLTSDKAPSYDKAKVIDALSSHPPYREALARHL